MTVSDVVIRDAACVVLIDRTGSQIKLLLGRRRADQVFLPNKWVFPGGRVDDDDRALSTALDFPERHRVPDALKSFALAGIRELAEETGFCLAKPVDDTTAATPVAPQRAGLSVDSGASWQTFGAQRLIPDLQALTAFARAVTPPGRVRRYDTWFFLAERDRVHRRLHTGDDELLDLDWFTMADTARLDLPIITRLVLSDVAASLERPLSDPPALVPFYHHHDGQFRRQMVELDAAPLPP